jgi:Mce-associated membrane protein
MVVVSAALAGCGSGAKPTPIDSGYTPAMQAALAAANRIAVDLTTYDYRSLDAFYAKMKSLGTAYFNQNLQANRADTIAYDQRLKVISEGSVVASAAKPAAADGTVTVLMFVDQRLRSSGAKSGLLEQVRVQMVMKPVNGQWLADQATVTGSS